MTLKHAIQEKNVKVIRKIASELPVADIADLLEEMQPAERVIFFRLLKADVQTDIFSQLEPEYQEHLIRAFSDEQIKEIVGDLFTDEIADLIEDVPSDIAARIIRNTSRDVREDINKILRFNEDQVGSVMTVDIITLKQSMTIGQSLKLIKQRRDEDYVGHYFFVVDKNNVLVGSVKLEDLAFAKNTQKVKEFVKPTGFVSTTTNKEEAALEFADQDQSILPVVNEKREVIGVITADDMIDVVQEAVQEDFQKMAGISHDAEVPYSRTSIWRMFKSRVLWLGILMFASTLSQIVDDAAQAQSHHWLLNSAIWTSAIVAVLPVIAGVSGNSGTQASTMVIRALANGDITTKDYRKVLWKEFRVAFWVGFALGLANFARLIVYYSIKGYMHDGVHHQIGELNQTSNAIDYVMLSFAASFALFIVVILSKTLGGVLPLIAKKCKLDPAVMSAPILTTLLDASSAVILWVGSIGLLYMVLPH